MCDDENCQSTKSTKSVYDDKNCQSTQCLHMCPAKNSSYMWSVTKPSQMQLPKPAMKQSTYKKFHQDDKNCQSANYMCYDKKSQVRSEGTPSSFMPSVPKTASNQVGTQPEITGNIEHSTSKSCYPPESTKVSPVSRNYKIQSNHSDYSSSNMHSPKKRSVNPRKM